MIAMAGMELFDLSLWRQIQFELPMMLWLLPVPLLVHFLLPARKKQSAALIMPTADAAAVRDHRALRGRGRAANPLLWLAWCALVVAAALPRLLGPPVTPPAMGRDLMVVLDLSASMTADDMTVGARQVDRLTAAKVILDEFLERREGDRIGLIAFGSNAYVVTPLTRDLKAVQAQLATLEAAMAGPATAIGDAVALAVKRLDTPMQSQRVVILLTDGYNTAGTLTTDDAADLAARLGVRTYAVGFGDDPALTIFGFRLPINMPRDDIDEQALQRLAAATSGKAFRARKTEELAQIYNEIQQLEPITRKSKSIRPVISLYYWPLALALALSLGALCWDALQRRRA